MVKRFFANRKVCFPEFYHLGTDNETFLHNFTAKENAAIKTMPLVKIAVGCAGKIICPMKNGSSAQHVKSDLTDSVFTCGNNI